MYDYTVIDKDNPDAEGLSQLEVVTDELYQEDDFDYLCGNEGYEGPGVFNNRIQRREHSVTVHKQDGIIITVGITVIALHSL